MKHISLGRPILDHNNIDSETVVVITRVIMIRLSVDVQVLYKGSQHHIQRLSLKLSMCYNKGCVDVNFTIM